MRSQTHCHNGGNTNNPKHTSSPNRTMLTTGRRVRAAPRNARKITLAGKENIP
jgi:hypothetical protein